MKRKNIELWVEALESGEYVQGKNHLCTPKDEFCCLGVLCELDAQQTGGYWEIDESKTMMLYKGREGLPSSEVVRRFLGSYSLGVRAFIDQLVDMNDSGASFKKIAKEIRKKWL